MKIPKAILFLAYGTPENANDIKAYYTDIRRGNPPEAAQLKELQDRYAMIGGKTPLLQITREQAKLLEQRLGIKTYVGMKHWHPYIHETIKQIDNENISQIIAIAMTPHYSSMSIGDYRNRLQKAIDKVNPAMRFQMKERWGDNSIFIDSICQRIEATRKKFPVPSYDEIEVIFTAHSLPIKILESGDPYQKELIQTSNLAAKELRLPRWRQAFQSAGRTRDTWLGPDILQELQKLASEGSKQVLIAPIGFTTDNLEILYDLDIQAATKARELEIIFKRIDCANTTPRFIDALEDIIKPLISPDHL